MVAMVVIGGQLCIVANPWPAMEWGDASMNFHNKSNIFVIPLSAEINAQIVRDSKQNKREINCYQEKQKLIDIGMN